MLRFEIVQDSEQIKEFWNILSPKETIYDDWEFRQCFQKYFQYPLMCHVGYEGDKLIGILPLQLNTDKNYLEFFGGNYMEDNRVLIRKGYEQYIPEFYKQIVQPAVLEYIRGDDPFTASLPIQDYKYVLPLQGFKTYEEYFSTYLDGVARGKMRRKIRKVEKEQVVIRRNNFADLDFLFTWNMANFGDHSSFNDRPFHKEIFQDLLKFPYETFLLTFEVNNKKEGVSLAILYNGVYEYFNLGVNKTIPGLSTFVSIKNLEMALTSGAYLLDAFTGDYGWKEHWRFKKIPQHSWKK